jgi:hypothetical protein
MEACMKFLVWAAAAALPMQLSVAVAGADCMSRVADIDQRLQSDQVPANQRVAIQQFRDQAADLCAKGAEPTAMQVLDMLDMMLPAMPAEATAAENAPGSGEGSKARLSDAFLAGTWCSMTGEERVQLVFSADGTYRPCFPAGGQGYVNCGPGKSTDDWVASWADDKSQDPNEMVLATARGRPMVFKRGACTAHGR